MKLNRGPQAPALLILNGSDVSLENCQVHNNRGDGTMGAIALLPPRNHNGSESVFVDSGDKISRKREQDDGVGDDAANSSVLLSTQPNLHDQQEKGFIESSFVEVVDVTFWQNIQGSVTCGEHSNVTRADSSLSDGPPNYEVEGGGAPQLVSLQIIC
jgi:hypothetical protein